VSRPAPHPPRLAEALLRIALDARDRECVLSDLSEEFEARVVRGSHQQARAWYWRQALTSLRPALARRWGRHAPTSQTTGLPPGGLWRMRLDSWSRELRWSWRGVRTRRWRAAFVVGLLGVALAANAIVFAAADAFVFHTLPYWEPDRLVVIEKVGHRVFDYLLPAELSEWRRHRELFAGVEGHVSDGAYLTIGGATESVPGEDVTPGLLGLLGVMPRWGRPFIAHDAEPGVEPTALISESLARRLYGDPTTAVGRKLATGRDELTIIGVMPASFRFPTALEEFWRPLNLSTWPDHSGLRDVIRLAPEQTIAGATARVAALDPIVERARGSAVVGQTMRLRSMAAVRGNPGAAQIFMMLVGAAGCLLLIACANVASLEIAAASERRRVYAIHAALGATRASLVRVGLLEGAVLLGASAAVAMTLALWGTQALSLELTAAMRDALVQPIAVDPRGMVFMLAIASATWLVTSLPVIWRITRTSVVDGLRDDTRTMPVTRASARARQTLMSGQVALTALLLVGSLLYLRTYAARLGIDKGFDADNIVTIAVGPAPDAAVQPGPLVASLLERLRATPGVRAVSNTDSFPPSTTSGISAPLTIDDRPATREQVKLHMVVADPNYFQTMQIPVVEGVAFDATTPADQVVVDERFARKYWPGTSAIGSRFHVGGGGFGEIHSFHIIGVSRTLAADQLQTDAGDEVFVGYMRLSPTYHPLTLVARVDAESRASDLAAIVRSLAGRSVVRVDTVAARYARLAGDTRLAAIVTTGFGLIALLVAASGIYAVMAFLVAGRSKEIAIRLALGADGRTVRRLVLATSLRFAGAGVAAGLIAAMIASRWIAAQLFGVTSTDPLTYGAVVATVVILTLAATWRPASRASRVDPAVTLRAQ
jgi:putative ABC transport system permease protein